MIKLIKNVTIIDPRSNHHLRKVDILVEGGKISTIGENVQHEEAEVIEAENLHVSPGWFDLSANFCDPGFEYKEDIKSGIESAKYGGFTGVLLKPNTNPPIDSKASVEYIINSAKFSEIDVYPAGTLSTKQEGKDLSEMYDMKCAGALAFTDDKKTIASSELMSRALLYAKNFDGVIMTFPMDESLTKSGQMHEGGVSTKLGLKGIPSLAEELRISRDLQLANYNDAPIHFSTVSTQKGVDLIREAKKEGIKVTCDVAVHQLSLTEELVNNYDANYKVMPPLRGEEDVNALIEGVKDGTIDAVCTDHSPENIENKKVEFEHANSGVIGLESAFGILNKTLNTSMDLTEIIEKITIQPRNILGLENPLIEEGEKANITLFDPHKKWTFTEADIKSKSKNNPYIGFELMGKPLGIIN